MANSNSNFNFNAEMEKNVKSKVKGGKVYVKIGNKFVLRNAKANVSPVRKYTRNQLNILGPSAHKLNNKRLENALKVYNNTVQRQRANASTLNKAAYNNAVKHLLSRPYVYNKLKSVGVGNFKSYSAISKNNKTLRGFAVYHNSRANGNRILNLLVTHSGGGIGKILMNHIIKNARAHGKSVIRLQSVKKAVPFYNQFGFVSTGHVNGLTPMRKRL